MAFADYYQRGAVAAAQVLAGFDEDAFKRALQRPVGVSAGRTAVGSAQGRAICDLTIRLLARLYPTLHLGGIIDSALRDELASLAAEINPAIELAPEQPSMGVVVGDGSPFSDCAIYAGADAWIARVGTERPYPTGDAGVPFGAGAAACLAAANLFRLVAVPNGRSTLDRDSAYCTYRADASDNPVGAPAGFADVPHLQDAALIGAGAIGQAAAWALAQTDLRGALHVVDSETVELSNLQRYVLSRRTDEGAVKVDLTARHLSGSLEAKPVRLPWADFVDRHGHGWRHALVALDSARDRRLVQASLPRDIVNAWTQPGDLGVSSHGRFGTDAACLACLYLPHGSATSEDILIAEALGIPEQAGQVRELLYQGAPAPREMLEAVARAHEIDPERLLPYAGRPLRDLYAEGLCGGGAIPLERIGRADRTLHVPLAFQSALAGVQLAASFARRLVEPQWMRTTVTRIDVLSPLGVRLCQPSRADPDGGCICRDGDYRAVYEAKWGAKSSATANPPRPAHT